jgi:hypothetical protein
MHEAVSASVAGFPLMSECEDVDSFFGCFISIKGDIA